MNTLHTPSLIYARKTVMTYMGVLIACVLILALAHWLYSDLKVGRVYWFNLDKERNLPTWFSGMLFFMFGCSAFVAYYWERKKNEVQASFRLPILWIGIGLAGFYMSLDEITILHENMFWRETRYMSSELGESWKFFTQWQLLFAPAILLGFVYFVLFFTNRYRTSKSARISAFTGIGCWITALSLEGLRETFKLQGANWYQATMIMEEMLESIGAIFLLGAVAFYILTIAFRTPADHEDSPSETTPFFSKQAIIALVLVFSVLSITTATIYFFAQKHSESDAPAPHLYKKALK